jgi:hypothetical protein
VLKTIGSHKEEIIKQQKDPKESQQKRNVVIENAARIGRLKFPKSLGTDLDLNKICFNDSIVNNLYDGKLSLRILLKRTQIKKSKKRLSSRGGENLRILGMTLSFNLTLSKYILL